MSKKNSKAQQQKGPQIIDLPNLKVAESVAVLMPQSLAAKKESNPLLEGYMRAKLNGKRVTVGHNFVALLKGKEENFIIEEIDGISAHNMEEG